MALPTPSVVPTRNLVSLEMACHLHGHPLRVPPGHLVRPDPITPRICPPTLTFQKGRPTRSTNLRRLCGETSIMPRKTRLLRSRRITDRTGLHHLLIRLAQVGYDRDRPFQMLIIINITPLLRAPQVPTHPLVTPSIPFPRLPKLIFPRSTENGVAFWAPVQVVQYAL